MQAAVPLPANDLHTQLLLSRAQPGQGWGVGLVNNNSGLGHQLAGACRVLGAGHTFSSLEVIVISPVLWLGKARLREVMRLAQGTEQGRGHV